MKYKYECPTEKGYEKFRISRSEQNRIFKYRKWQWSLNSEFYVKGNHIILQNTTNIYGCIASTLLFPVGVLMEGFSNIKEVYLDMVIKVWQCKKYGTFSGDDIYKREVDDGTFDKLIKLKERKANSEKKI
jgi:hypothetical protein